MTLTLTTSNQTGIVVTTESKRVDGRTYQLPKYSNYIETRPIELNRNASKVIMHVPGEEIKTASYLVTFIEAVIEQLDPNNVTKKVIKFNVNLINFIFQLPSNEFTL